MPIPDHTPCTAAPSPPRVTQSQLTESMGVALYLPRVVPPVEQCWVPGRLSFSRGSPPLRRVRVPLVRSAGSVCHKPPMVAPVTGPAATCHTVNVASVTRRHAELAGRLGTYPRSSSG